MTEQRAEEWVLSPTTIDQTYTKRFRFINDRESVWAMNIAAIDRMIPKMIFPLNDSKGGVSTIYDRETLDMPPNAIDCMNDIRIP